MIILLTLTTISLGNIWISFGGNCIDVGHYWDLKGLNVSSYIQKVRVLVLKLLKIGFRQEVGSVYSRVRLQELSVSKGRP